MTTLHYLHKKKNLSSTFYEIYQNCGIYQAMTAREIKVKYKQTVIGMLWVLLQPLIYTMILAIVFSHFIKFETKGIPYTAFVLPIIIAWTFFSKILTVGTTCLIDQSHIITKIYFPRLLIHLSKISSCALDMLVGYVFLIPIICITINSITIKILLLPLFSIMLIILGFGIICLTSSLNVFYRDLGILMGFITQIWMYASPILYPIPDFSPRNYFIYCLNPLAGIFESMRWCIFPSYAFPVEAFTIALLETMIAFIMGMIFFKTVENKIMDTL